MKLEIDIKKRRQELVDEFNRVQNTFNQARARLEQIRGALAELQKIEGDGRVKDKPEKRI